MVRTIIKPNMPKINLSIPPEYVGEEIEVLAFPVNGMDNHDKPTKSVPVFGCLKGQIKISDDFDEPLEDFKDYM
jgi:hypothetical protein